MILQKLWRSSIIIWSIAFLIINIAVTQDGGTNAKSRFAALRAITESGELNIDKYRHWTIDWSQSPNGHYYSNKAPGSFLLVLPEFWLIDNLALIWDWDNKEESGIRGAPGHFQKTTLSFLGQVIPFLLILYLAMQLFQAYGYRNPSIHWMIVAMLFGSTASIFMNNWFGHGFAALLYILSILMLWEGWMLGLGLVLSALVLSDYSAALFLIPFVVAKVLIGPRTHRSFQMFVLGGLPCLAIWMWYHTTAFGGITQIATMYINPSMQDLKEEGAALFGVISLYPKLGAMYELMLGGMRGVLVTQPWAIVSAVIAIVVLFKQKLSSKENVIAGLLLCNFLILYLFNASVGAWHGGFTAGPRYMTTALLGLGFLIPIIWAHTNKIGKWILCGTIVYSIIFRAFVYGTTILAPPKNLWTWFYEEFSTTSSGTPYLRTGIFILLVGVAAWRVKQIEQSQD